MIDVLEVSMKLCQDGNTMGTTQEYEELKVSVEFQSPNEDYFVVLKTDGWSINSSGEIEAVVKKAMSTAEDLIKFHNKKGGNCEVS